jgi:nicotinamidase-related amidase
MTIDPRRTALLVMDYQPTVVGNVSDADALLSRVSDAIAIARRRGAYVGYVRVAFDDTDFAAVPPHSRMAPLVASRGKQLHADSPGTAIHPDLQPEPGDIVVRKTRIGAFSTTDLHERLSEKGITTLILAGISTSGVVLSTVRDGHDRDYQMFVLADGTTDPDPEIHEFLIARIFPRQADIIQLADLDQLFS